MKKNKSKLYMGVFIIFLMVSSTIGFIFGSSGYTPQEQNINSDGPNFVNGFWVFEYNGFNYRFKYLAEESFDYNSVDLNNDLFLYTDAILSQDQLSRLNLFFASNSINYQIIDNLECGLDTQVLVLKLGLDKIYKDSNCLVLEGDIDRNIDRIGYSLIVQNG